MKTSLLCQLCGLLLLVPAAFAQSEFLINKQNIYAQTSANGPVVGSALGLSSFNLNVQTPAATTVTPPGLPPLTIPFNSAAGKFEANYLYTSKAALDAAFPNGNYQVGSTGFPLFIITLTSDLYPSSIPTVTTGTWQNNLLVIPNATQSYTLTFNTFAAYGSNAGGQLNGIEGLQIQSAAGQDNVNLTQTYANAQFAGITQSGTPFTSYVIPAGALTPGLVYRCTLNYDAVVDKDTATVSGGLIVGYYEALTVFYLTVRANTPPTAPAIVTQPVSISSPLGSSATFNASYSGGSTSGASGLIPTSFFWYYNNQILSGSKYVFGSNGSLTINNVAAADAGTYVLQVFNSSGLVTSNPATLTIGSAGTAPAIVTQPVPQVVSGAGSGTTVVFSATAINASSYQWQLGGVNVTQANAAGATSSTLLITGASNLNAGAYTCVVTNPSGSVTSNPAQLTISNVTNVGRLINLSVNTTAGKSQLLTVGFVTGGTGTSGSQNLLIRATGPALGALGVSGTLADPTLTVLNGQTVVNSNDNWGTPATNQSAVTAADTATFAFPLTNPASLDAALVAPLAAGGYTVQIGGNTSASGTALAEVYDTTPTASYTATSPRLINISSNTSVAASGALTAGFVIGGITSKTVLIRATGPALAALGVAGTMPDPQLALHTTSNSQDIILASNAGWGGNPQITTVSNSVFAFPLTNPASKDSAILITLSPGAYTAVASSATGTAGTAVIEVYEVP